MRHSGPFRSTRGANYFMHSPMCHRCHFATFKQCQEWAKRLNRAITHPSRLEDLFALAYHAWCLGGSADDEDQHVHLCRPGHRHSDLQFQDKLVQDKCTNSECFFLLCVCVCFVCLQAITCDTEWKWRSRGWGLTHKMSGECRT